MGDRSRNKLTAVSIRNAPDGKLQDGGGLILNKKGDAGKWVYRYSFLGRRREMGLGSLDDISLSAARRARDDWSRVLADGKDPISERELANAQIVAERERLDPTFEDMAEIAFEARKVKLRGEGERGKWMSPIKVHMIPKIGRRQMSKISPTDIRTALAPIWRTKYPTAKKCIERTRFIFEHAKQSGIDCTPESVERAQTMLGDVRHKPQRIVATPWQDIPDLYARLSSTSPVQRCMRFIILTAVRSEAAIHARFDEIEGDVWTVPAVRMKASEGSEADFRVPLSGAALDIVQEAEAYYDTFLFPGQSGRKGIVGQAMHRVLDDMGEPGRPHGFRTSFRTWVQDTEAATYDVAETALAHIVGNKVERSYARSDLLEARAVLMEKWARFVTGESAAVVKLRR